MAEPRARDALFDPVFRRNPIGVLILGICSALVVTKRLETALAMAVSVTAVLACSNTILSALRRQVGSSVRLFVEITVIASLVIVVSEVLQAYFPDLRRQLSVFVGLIVTNCIVMGRAEGFALSHRVRASFLDGLGNGLGYSAVLLAVAAVRELFGYGTLFGHVVLRPEAEGGWYVPNGLLLLAPSAFFVLGGIVWALRTGWPGGEE